MCVARNMRGSCQEFMRTRGGLSCKGMYLLGFEAFCSMGDLVAQY
jgi:hypothetical protein